MMRYWLILFVLLLTTGVEQSYCSNTTREVRKIIRKARYSDNANEANRINNELKSAEKSVLEAIDKTDHSDEKAELYYLAGMIQSRINDIENAKIYLDKPYDTLTFYSSICKVYEYIDMCQSIEIHHGTHVYKEKSMKLLMNYRNNLLNGGRYYMKNKNYKVAYSMFDVYLTSLNYPIFQNSSIYNKDTDPKIAYWAVCAAFMTGNYDGVVKHTPIALAYTERKAHVQEYYCRALDKLDNTDKWLVELKKGLKNYPENDYFFTTLMAYYSNMRKYNEALFYTDRMIQINPNKWNYWFVKAQVHLCKEEYKECIGASEQVIKLEPTNVDAHYCMGLSYCNLAKMEEDSMKKAKIKSTLYNQHRSEMIKNYILAESPLQYVKTNRPENANQWAPLLYQVYLHLNKGKEFDEMDRLMKSINLK